MGHRFAVPVLIGLCLLASAGAARASSVEAALRVMTFELRQQASWQARMRLASRDARGLTEADRALPQQLLTGERPVPPELLARLWPYAQGAGAGPRRPAEPPLGELVFAAACPDLGQADPRSLLSQLHHYAGTLLGVGGQAPPYLALCDLDPAGVATVATRLAQAFGGDPERWQRSVARGLLGVTALVERASADLEARLQAAVNAANAAIMAKGEPGGYLLAQALWGLERNLAGLEGRRERLEAIHRHLANTLASREDGFDPSSVVLVGEDLEEL